jgi:hypothetical protein
VQWYRIGLDKNIYLCQNRGCANAHFVSLFYNLIAATTAQAVGVFAMGVNYITLDVSTLSIEELQQHRANAWHTCCQSLGHEKASRNHDLANRYAGELTRRGVELDESLDPEQNGDGCW